MGTLHRPYRGGPEREISGPDHVHQPAATEAADQRLALNIKHFISQRLAGVPQDLIMPTDIPRPNREFAMRFIEGNQVRRVSVNNLGSFVVINLFMQSGRGTVEAMATDATEEGRKNWRQSKPTISYTKPGGHHSSLEGVGALTEARRLFPPTEPVVPEPAKNPLGSHDTGDRDDLMS